MIRKLQISDHYVSFQAIPCWYVLYTTLCHIMPQKRRLKHLEVHAQGRFLAPGLLEPNSHGRLFEVSLQVTGNLLLAHIFHHLWDVPQQCLPLCLSCLSIPLQIHLRVLEIPRVPGYTWLVHSTSTIILRRTIWGKIWKNAPKSSNAFLYRTSCKQVPDVSSVVFCNLLSKESRD